jgi:hypothetical protein
MLLPIIPLIDVRQQGWNTDIIDQYLFYIRKSPHNAPLKLRAEGRASCPGDQLRKKRDPMEPPASTGG